jgi:hypothetical protein
MHKVLEPKQFEALSLAIEKFISTVRSGFRDVIEGVDVGYWKRIDEDGIAMVAEHFNLARLEALESSFDEEVDSYFSWVTGQPSFQVATRSLGFTPGDHLSGYKRVIQRQVSQAKWMPHLLEAEAVRVASLYLAYVGGIAKACEGFTTGKRKKAALEGPKAIKKMLALMEEIDQVRENTDFLEGSIGIGGRHWERVKSNLQGTLEHLFSTTKRDDRDLSARLMASEVIRLHMKLFSKPFKSAVFHIMGLPVLERSLEMKTIERLISLEDARTKGIKSAGFSVLMREVIC